MILVVLSSFLFLFHLFMVLFSWGFSYKEWLFEVCLSFVGSSVLSLFFVVDLFSVVFSSFIFLISFVVLFYSFYYMSHDLASTRFLALVLMFVGSMLLFVHTPSSLTMIFGWDGLGVTSFLLVIYYNNISSLRSGLVTIYTNRLGDVFFMFCLFFMFSTSWLMVDVYYIFNCFLLSLMLLLAGVTKSAQMPFSSWLPAAMSAPTPVSSLVHSSTLVTAGVYLYIRFYYFISCYTVSSFLLVMCLVTFFFAGVMAVLESDLKKLVAMSTLSQLGLLTCSFFMGQVFFTFFHMVTHALFKSLLFLTCGFMILTSYGSQDMRFMGSKVVFSSAVFLMLVLSVMSLLGFNFLSGFFSKDLIIDFLFCEEEGVFFCSIFIISCVFSILYGLKLMYWGLLGSYTGFTGLFSIFSLPLFIFMALLFLWSVCLGKLFFYLFLESEPVVFFLWQKIFNMFLLSQAVTLSALFFALSTPKPSFMSVIVSEMFYMNWFFGGWFSSKLKASFYLMGGESFWLEAVAPQKINSVISELFLNLSYKFNFFVASLYVLVFSFFMLFSLSFSLKSAGLKNQSVSVNKTFFLVLFTAAFLFAF